MLREGENDREEGRNAWIVRAPPPMQHLSHLEIIIHHASPVTGECVVLFNGRHWHDSSSPPPTACHQIATLAARIHFLAPVRRLDVCILAPKKFCLERSDSYKGCRNCLYCIFLGELGRVSKMSFKASIHFAALSLIEVHDFLNSYWINGTVARFNSLLIMN